MKTFDCLVTTAALAFAIGCTTQGTGTGDLETAGSAGAVQGSAVDFTWKSDGGSVTKGTMQANVPGHGMFQGKYMQITSQADAVGAGPYFEDEWYPGWGAWEGWGPEYGDEFVTNYSGRVVSVLKSETGEHMRCRFRLAEPSAGPEGGGMGECQLSNQEIIKDVQLQGD